MKTAVLWICFGLAAAVLPPGYEDELYCPAGYCKRRKAVPPGFVGPATAFWECSSETAEEPVRVTPWGSNHGEAKRTELLSQGFHLQLCESQASEQESAQDVEQEADVADESSDASEIKEESVTKDVEPVREPEEFSAGLKVWSAILGAGALAWWYSSREQGQASPAQPRAARSTRSSSVSDPDEMRRKRLEALSRMAPVEPAETKAAPVLEKVAAVEKPVPQAASNATAAKAETAKPVVSSETAKSEAKPATVAEAKPEAKPEAEPESAQAPAKASKEAPVQAPNMAGPSERPRFETTESQEPPVFAVKVRGTLGGVQTARSVEGMEATTSVEQLLEAIRKGFDSKDAKLRVFFNGKELKVAGTLGKLGIKSGSSLQAMFVTNTSSASSGAAASSAAPASSSSAAPAQAASSSAAPAVLPQPEALVPEEADGTDPSMVRAQGTFKGVVKAIEIENLAGSLSVLTLERRIAEAFESGTDHRLRLFYMGKELKDGSVKLAALTMKTGSTVQVMFKQGEPPRHADFSQLATAAAGPTASAVLAAAEAAGCNPGAVLSGAGAGAAAAAAAEPVSKEEAWRALAELEAQLRRAVDPSEDATSRQAATVLKQLLVTLTHDSNPALMQMAQASVPDLAKIWNCDATREWLIKTLNPDGSNSGSASSSSNPM